MVPVGAAGGFTSKASGPFGVVTVDKNVEETALELVGFALIISKCC